MEEDIDTSQVLVFQASLWTQPLSLTVGRTCNKAGITGFKTNLSLRVSNVSRLYSYVVDEQLVKEQHVMGVLMV